MNFPQPQPNEEELFHRALELPVSERAALLARECAGNDGLRAGVEALLKLHGEADSFLEKPAPEIGTALTPRAPVGGEKVGDVIGRYKLLQKIGEGGCGVVYMAEQEEPVRRRVALKVIKLGMDTKEVIARFEAERQALALMDHPNIARVFDGGATESGRPFFVMELVRGVPVTKFCDEQNLPTRARLELFTQVCHAVQHAHQKGIIHRDLKPSNILVTLHDGQPVPKVIDFGIAKATAGRLTDNTLFTAFEQFIGTPAYMSPEQAEMSGLDIDTRSDIYSLGVLLYELLTGRPPFDPKSLVSAGLDEIRRIIREVDPPRMSTRLSTLTDLDRATIAKQRGLAPAQLSTILRGDLDWIVMRCLEKDRTRRYETANGLALDVLRHLHDEPVVARPPSAGYRLRKLVRRNKMVFASAFAVTVALAGGLAVATVAFLRERQSHRRAVFAEKLAGLEARKSTEVARFLKEMLAEVGPGVALGRDTRLLREVLDKTAERMGRDLKDQPAVEIELRTTLGEVYRELGEYEKAETMLREALRLRKIILGANDAGVAEVLSQLAEVLEKGLRLIDAEGVARECVAILRRSPTRNPRALAHALGTLGWIQTQRHNYAAADLSLFESMRLLRGMAMPDELEIALTLNCLGVLRGSQNRPAEAESLLRESLNLRRKHLPIDHPEVQQSIGNLAIQLADPSVKKFAEAEQLQRDAIAATRKVMGPDHPVTALRLSNFAVLQRSQQKLDEAEALFLESLAIFKKTLGVDNLATPKRCPISAHCICNKASSRKRKWRSATR